MANFLVITASSSIGPAVVHLLNEAGHNIFKTARDNSKITPDAYLDATDFDAVEEIFQKAGDLAGVVNCSGSLLLKPSHLTTKDQYLSVIDSSLTTAFATVKAAGKYMTNGGSVVLISSAAAKEGFANHEAIASAKAGIIGLTLSAAATYIMPP
ncbi:MAG: SDR family oxidoreductase [Alphaproteobacteria bacterium]|nr:SDR family oxidoreductase [Alphaproteobacteria bacterium]